MTSAGGGGEGGGGSPFGDGNSGKGQWHGGGGRQAFPELAQLKGMEHGVKSTKSNRNGWKKDGWRGGGEGIDQ